MRQLILLFWLLFAASTYAADTNVFEFKDGDRVALIGDTFIEREQRYGYVEFVLTTQFPDRNVTFRNLGWSGDTPAGASRLGFDIETPAKGLERIREQITNFNPTVVFVGYGMASSFDGEAGLKKFTREMEQLLDEIEQICGKEKVRFVLLSPIPHEKLPPPLPDPAKHNEQLALYGKAIESIALSHKARFISLLKALERASFGGPVPPLTDDSIHLTAYGYRLAAEAIGRGLGWPPNAWRFGILKDGTLRKGSYGVQILEREKRDDYAKAVILQTQLGWPPRFPDETNGAAATPQNRFQVQGLKPGNYELRIDTKMIQTVSDQQCNRSIVIDHGPEIEQAAQLRDAILKKNELFFHRWRPENNTYLFLFRKHEQGQNAKEIPQFDPLVRAEEQKIAGLRKPAKHTIELVYAADQSIGPGPPTEAPKPKKQVSAVTEHPATPFRPQPPVVFQ
ncbi:MAG TPA: SGNH/GDSL hydrolase family protein, partial [Verrucomicrobiae bacterium]|nr:SGNH/GDSL hydrolase family protein [Verrucomicrobiae bacterium]